MGRRDGLKACWCLHLFIREGIFAMGLPPIELQVFKDNGYFRKQCRVTDLWFWTCDESRDTCGDTEEDEYTFIGNPIIDGYKLLGRDLKDSMREAFLISSKITHIFVMSPILFWLDGEMTSI